MLSILEFPHDGRIWRVDWFGEVSRNPEVPSEALVETFISPLRTDPSKTDPSANSAVEHSERKGIEIGVGQLPYVHIGSLWKNGERMEIRAGTSDTFVNIDIGPKTVLLVRADKTEGGIPLIPPNYYRLGSKSALSSFCLVVRRKNDPYGIIIPVMEAIRFYYASSTDLARAIFNGEFPQNPDFLLNREKSDLDIVNEDGKELKIFRFFPRRHMSDYDGYTVGRILFSDVANRNVQRIFNSMMKNKMNEGLSLPESGFPFIGTTTLNVHRKRIKCGDLWRNLVLTIDWCSGPFPFDRLSVEWNRGGHSPGEYAESNPLILSREGRQVSPPKNSGNMTIRSDRDPAILAGIVQYTLPSDRFGAMDGKSIIKVDPEDVEEEPGEEEVRLAALDLPITSYGTGEGSYGKSHSAPLEFVEDKNPGSDVKAFLSFQIFIDALPILNKATGIQAVFRVVGEPASPRGVTSFFPANRYHPQSHWEYLRFRTKQKRRAIIVDIALQNRHFCVVEIERRETENYKTYLFYVPDYSKLEDKTVRSVLEHLVKKEGRLKDEDSIPGIQWDSLIHTWENAEECGEKIMRKIMGMEPLPEEVKTFTSDDKEHPDGG